jgi:hypothetical protein
MALHAVMQDARVRVLALLTTVTVRRVFFFDTARLLFGELFLQSGVLPRVDSRHCRELVK